VEKTPDEDTIRFDTGGTERAVITSAGDVGIGTATPTEQLDVAGDIRSDTFHTNWDSNANGFGYMANDVVIYEGQFYKNISSANADITPNLDTVNWALLQRTGFVGEIKAFGGASTPTGTLVCDGTPVNRTVYADLFAVIGTTYGAGDGSTTFNLPDLRGEFLRGLDGGRGIDASRILGSSQTDATQLINDSTFPAGRLLTHSTQTTNAGSAISLVPLANAYVSSSTAVTFQGTTVFADLSLRQANLTFNNSQSVRTATEDRPRNVAVNYVIVF
jgi:microcystin-dependent protein